jgi:hypothetical protein
MTSPRCNNLILVFGIATLGKNFSNPGKKSSIFDKELKFDVEVQMAFLYF